MFVLAPAQNLNTSRCYFEKAVQCVLATQAADRRCLKPFQKITWTKECCRGDERTAAEFGGLLRDFSSPTPKSRPFFKKALHLRSRLFQFSTSLVRSHPHCPSSNRRLGLRSSSHHPRSDTHSNSCDLTALVHLLLLTGEKRNKKGPGQGNPPGHHTWKSKQRVTVHVEMCES